MDHAYQESTLFRLVYVRRQARRETVLTHNFRLLQTWLTAMQVALADVIDVIDGRKLFNQLLLTNLRNCNYFTHLPPKSLIFHHPCNQNSFRNNNSAYLPLTLNQEDKFQTYFGTGDSFWDPLRNFLHKFTRIVLSVYKLNKLGKFW